MRKINDKMASVFRFINGQNDFLKTENVEFYILLWQTQYTEENHKVTRYLQGRQDESRVNLGKFDMGYPPRFEQGKLHIR